MTEGSWVEIRTGTDHSAITIMGKIDSTGEISLIYYRSNHRLIDP